MVNVLQNLKMMFMQGHADFPGDLWCQDPGCDYDVEDNVDLLEVQEAL